MGRINAVLLALLVAGAGTAAAQDAAGGRALARQIEQRFDVLPVQGGVVLRPKTAVAGVRSIEVNGGAIAIDGEPVTGAELRRRLDADADPILRLSYLDPLTQRALFESRQPEAPAQPAAAAPPAVPAPAPQAPPAAAPARPERPRRSSDRVRIGGSVRVGPDEVINGDVAAIGGSATVEGQVHGDVVAVGGGVTLGPRADIDGDVTVVGGPLTRDPRARVGGEIQEVGIGGLGGWRFWPPFSGPRQIFGAALGSVFALVSTMTRLAVLCILASIVLLLARDPVERVSIRAASEPFKAGAVGFLIQLLFFPVLVATIVLLIVTIVGIPLLLLVPFAILAVALIALMGFTAVAYDVGRLVMHRAGAATGNPYVVAAAGIALVLSPIVLSRILGLAGAWLWPVTWALLLLGLLAEYVAWTVGLGAMALVRFDRKAAIQPS